MDRSLTHRVPVSLLIAWGISGASFGFGVVAMGVGLPFIALGLILTVYLSVRDWRHAGVGMLACLLGAGIAILATTMGLVSDEVRGVKLMFTSVGLVAAGGGILGISLHIARARAGRGSSRLAEEGQRISS